MRFILKSILKQPSATNYKTGITLGLVLVSLIWTILGGACTSALPSPTIQATITAIRTETAPPPASSQPPVLATATATTATPLPEKDRILLVIPEKTDPILANQVKSTLQELAAEARIGMVEQPGLAAADLKPAVRMVFYLTPGADLAQLAAGAPRIQFVALGSQEIQPTPNLSMVGLKGNIIDQQAFLAGYIAAITTPDWRVGILSLGGDPVAEKAQAAFLNGARYFCGLCKPFYPPFNSYPTAASVQKDDWQAAADALLKQSVETVYIYPGASSPALLAYLAKGKVQLIGGLPVNDTEKMNWSATINFDAAPPLRQIWPDLLAGKGGKQIPINITLSEVSASLLPAARQRLVQDIINGLASGQINPAVVP
jgi:hypothetical protein